MVGSALSPIWMGRRRCRPSRSAVARSASVGCACAPAGSRCGRSRGLEHAAQLSQSRGTECRQRSWNAAGVRPEQERDRDEPAEHDDASDHHRFPRSRQGFAFADSGVHRPPSAPLMAAVRHPRGSVGPPPSPTPNGASAPPGAVRLRRRRRVPATARLRQAAHSPPLPQRRTPRPSGPTGTTCWHRHPARFRHTCGLPVRTPTPAGDFIGRFTAAELRPIAAQ